MSAADAITATNDVARGPIPCFTTLGRQSFLPKNRLSEIKEEVETQHMQEAQGIESVTLEQEENEFTPRVRGREESFIPNHKVREREVSFIPSRDIPKSFEGFIHTNPSVSALNDQYIQSLREQLNATTDQYMPIPSYLHRPMQAVNLLGNECNPQHGSQMCIDCIPMSSMNSEKESKEELEAELTALRHDVQQIKQQLEEVVKISSASLNSLPAPSPQPCSDERIRERLQKHEKQLDVSMKLSGAVIQKLNAMEATRRDVVRVKEEPSECDCIDSHFDENKKGKKINVSPKRCHCESEVMPCEETAQRNRNWLPQNRLQLYMLQQRNQAMLEERCKRKKQKVADYDLQKAKGKFSQRPQEHAPQKVNHQWQQSVTHQPQQKDEPPSEHHVSFDESCLTEMESNACGELDELPISDIESEDKHWTDRFQVFEHARIVERAKKKVKSSVYDLEKARKLFSADLKTPKTEIESQHVEDTLRATRMIRALKNRKL